MKKAVIGVSQQEGDHRKRKGGGINQASRPLSKKRSHVGTLGREKRCEREMERGRCFDCDFRREGNFFGKRPRLFLVSRPRRGTMPIDAKGKVPQTGERGRGNGRISNRKFLLLERGEACYPPVCYRNEGEGRERLETGGRQEKKLLDATIVQEGGVDRGTSRLPVVREWGGARSG